MEYSSLDVGGLRFGEPVPGQKITSVALQCTDGEPVRLCFGSPAAPLTSPWHPDTLQQDSTKINLSLVCPPQLKEWIETLEQNAQEAMLRLGLEPKTKLVRGGTDGSRLSFMGLPCPNLFTGEMAIHGKQEYVFVQDMEMAMLTIAEVVKIYEEKA